MTSARGSRPRPQTRCHGSGSASACVAEASKDVDSGVQLEAPEVLESGGEFDVCQHCIVVATDKSSSFVGE